MYYNKYIFERFNMPKLNQDILDNVKDAVDLGLSDDVVRKLTKISRTQLQIYKRFGFSHTKIKKFFGSLRKKQEPVSANLIKPVPTTQVVTISEKTDKIIELLNQVIKLLKEDHARSRNNNIPTRLPRNK
jgi:hypothetical protein